MARTLIFVMQAQTSQTHVIFQLNKEASKPNGVGGVCVSIRGCTRINWGVYVYQLGGVRVSIGRGVYVSIGGCMRII